MGSRLQSGASPVEILALKLPDDKEAEKHCLQGTGWCWGNEPACWVLDRRALRVGDACHGPATVMSVGYACLRSQRLEIRYVLSGSGTMVTCLADI